MNRNLRIWPAPMALALILCLGQACYERSVDISGDTGPVDVGEGTSGEDMDAEDPDENSPETAPDIPPPGATWIMTMGGAVFDDLRSVAESSDGGLMMVGRTESFGTCGFWLVKADRDGRIAWQKVMVQDTCSQGDVIVPSRAGGFVAAGSIMSLQGDWSLFLLRISQDGAPLWMNVLQQPHSSAAALVERPDGSFFVGGYLLDAGGGEDALAFTSVDASGNVMWHRTIGVDLRYGQLTAASLSDGGVLVAFPNAHGQGSFLMALDAEGHVLWSKGTELSIESIAVLPDGGIAAVGSWSDTEGTTGLLVMRMDAAGSPLWQRTWTTRSITEPVTVTRGVGGGIILLVNEDTGPDYSAIGLIGIDDAGEPLWHRRIATGMADWAWDALRLSSGDLAVVGRSGSLGLNLYHDAFISRLDADGRVGGSCGILEDEDTVLGHADLTVEYAEIVLEESSVSTLAQPVVFADTPAEPVVHCPE